MIDTFVPFSPKALAAYHDALRTWVLAMEAVPSYLRNGLNVHQVYSIPAVSADADAAIKTGRATLKTDGPVHHFIGYRDGAPVHVCRT